MLRNFWYIGCASSRLRNSPRATKILDRDLVLFRDSNGQAHALEDRCCHRGVRLSLGKITEGAIACRYHGWRYDGSGRCIHIPSLPSKHRLPESFGVTAFPTAEICGYVWVWMGDIQAISPPPELPDFLRHRWRQGAFSARCNWMKMVENNVDWCHVVFAHEWTHPVFFIRLLRGPGEFNYEVRITETAMITFTPPTINEDDPIPDKVLASFKFELPDRLEVRQYFGGKSGRGINLIAYFHFVPTTANSCRIEWMIPSVFPVGPRVSWSARKPKILVQDKELLESAQSWYDREGSDFEHSVESDISQIAVRRLVERALQQNRTDRLPKRRVVRVRV